MTYSKSIAHSKVCHLKFSKCPKKECKETFLWLPSGPKGYCQDHVVLTESIKVNEWNFEVYLNKIYNPDTNRTRYLNSFKSVLLLRGQSAFQGEAKTIDRLALNVFQYLGDLFFALVCLDDSKFALETNKKFISKSTYFLSAYVNVGFGPFTKGHFVTPIFQDQKCRKRNCLRLTPELLSKFELKSRLHPCTECTNTHCHIHFHIQKLAPSKKYKKY